MLSPPTSYIKHIKLSSSLGVHPWSPGFVTRALPGCQLGKINRRCGVRVACLRAVIVCVFAATVSISTSARIFVADHDAHDGSHLTSFCLLQTPSKSPFNSPCNSPSNSFKSLLEQCRGMSPACAAAAGRHEEVLDLLLEAQDGEALGECTRLSAKLSISKAGSASS